VFHNVVPTLQEYSNIVGGIITHPVQELADAIPGDDPFLENKWTQGVLNFFNLANVADGCFDGSHDNMVNDFKDTAQAVQGFVTGTPAAGVPENINVGNQSGVSGSGMGSVMPGMGGGGMPMARGAQQHCVPLDCYGRCQMADLEQQKKCTELNEQCQEHMKAMGCPGTRCETGKLAKSCGKKKASQKVWLLKCGHKKLRASSKCLVAELQILIVMGLTLTCFASVQLQLVLLLMTFKMS